MGGALMAWIESHQALADHPKTRKLARILSIGKPTVIGHLHCFWWWALDYADDGDLRRFDALDIAIGAEWDGDPDTFVMAMVQAGFIDDGDALTIHDWEDYAGKLLNRRRANAKRMKEARAAQNTSQGDDVQDTCDERAAHVQSTQRARVERPDQTRPDQTEKTSRARKRATQIPQNFTLSDSLIRWGTDPERGFTVEQMESQIPRFIDHYTSKGEARKDWDASFRTWMRNARDYGHLGRKDTPTNRYNADPLAHLPADEQPPDNLLGPALMDWYREREARKQRGTA